MEYLQAWCFTIFVILGHVTCDYFENRDFYPTPESDGYLSNNPEYANYWIFNQNGFQPQMNEDLPDVLKTLQPVYEASKFISEPTQDAGIYNQLERGRSDIDPDDDNAETGYFYPKPKVQFELPSFVPLSNVPDGAAPAEEVTVIATTVNNVEETTPKTTTTTESYIKFDTPKVSSN